MNTSLYSPQLKAILSAQEELRPSPAVKTRLMARISVVKSSPQTRPWIQPALEWATNAAVAILAMLVLWAVVQPGTVLAWESVPTASTFRIYRAADGSNFELLQEIQADKKVERYTFLDPLLIPGKHYQYRIEGLQEDGQVEFQETISGNTLAALPAQLAILLTSLILAYGALSFTKFNQHPYFLRFSVS